MRTKILIFNVLLFSMCWLTAAQANITNGRYTLVNKYNSKVITVADASQKNGTNIYQWSDSSGTNQQWEIEDLGNGYYSIKAAHSGKSMDVWGWNASDGADLRQYSYTGELNQQWSFIDNGDGYYRIISRYSGKAIDVSGWSGDDGGNLHLWEDFGSDNQLWKMQSPPAPTPSPITPFVVNYSSNSSSLTASSDPVEVPTGSGLASQKFVVSNTNWNAVWYTDWSTHDLLAYNTLDFWIKSDTAGKSLSVNISDGTNTHSSNIITSSDASWQHISIDLSTINEIDFTKWSTITFGCSACAVDTTFYINNVQFLYMAPYTGPEITVVSWNGAQSAISLTFDDGLESQLDIAAPALDAKDLDATFFITETAITGNRIDDWKNLMSNGHEIGNHSKHHYEPSDNPTQSNQRTYDDTLGYDETVAAQTAIAQAMGTNIFSYAYPYTNNDPFLVKYLRDTHLSARGGWGPDGTYAMKSSYNPDWTNISCLFTGSTATFNSTYKSVVDTAMSQKAWTVFGIHGVGDANTSLPLEQLNLLIDYLDANRSSLWIAPYGTISRYWRAQKIIESSPANATSTGTDYAWNVPDYFPDNINVKVKLKNAEGYQLVQNGSVIQPDADGNYTISFNAELVELINN